MAGEMNFKIVDKETGEFPRSANVHNYVLAAGAAKTVTVPAGATRVAFSATDDFYARWTGAAAIPSVDVTDGTGAEINPALREVAPGASFSLVAPRACVVACAFYG